MKTERLYRGVADDLLMKIVAGDYEIGDRLPAERELVQTYNVSRPTIREAMIALEIAGCVEVRKGSGVYVINTESSGFGGSDDLNVGPFELTEARMVIESEAAALAASRISPEEVEQLSAIINRMKFSENTQIDTDYDAELPSDEQADREFHMLIARATHNSALVSIIDDLWSLRERSKLTQTMYRITRLSGVRPSIDEHWEIQKALAAGDPVRAREAMRTHLSRVIETLFKATEIEAVEQVKQRLSSEYKRFIQS